MVELVGQATEEIDSVFFAASDLDAELLQAIAERAKGDVQELGGVFADSARAIQRGQDQRPLEVRELGVEVEALTPSSRTSSGR